MSRWMMPLAWAAVREVDAGHVHVRDAGDRARLREEPLHEVVVLRQLRREHLDGHAAVELGVVTVEDRAHAALADLALDLEVAQAVGESVRGRPYRSGSLATLGDGLRLVARDRRLGGVVRRGRCAGGRLRLRHVVEIEARGVCAGLGLVRAGLHQALLPGRGSSGRGSSVRGVRRVDIGRGQCQGVVLLRGGRRPLLRGPQRLPALRAFGGRGGDRIRDAAPAVGAAHGSSPAPAMLRPPYVPCQAARPQNQGYLILLT